MSVDLSIVVPAFNEEKNVSIFTQRISQMLAELELNAELILIDDGSIDNTWNEIQLVASGSHIQKIKGIRLSSNFGQLTAIEYGMRETVGNWILTMDIDLQHPIELIKVFWQERLAYDVIQGKQIRRNERKIKAVLSHSFYKIIRKVSGLEIIENVGEFRLMSKETANILLSMNTRPLVFRFLIPKIGFKCLTINFESNKRINGKTKYNFIKLIKLATTSIVTTTTRPLYLGVYLSSIFILLSLLESCWILTSFLMGKVIAGWTSMTLILTTSLAAMFGILGIIGVYLAKLIDLTMFPKPGHFIKKIESK
jgi:polyisoprenyl-phosphate glycosyltransferase